MTYRNGMEASCETIAPELRNVPNSTLQREKGQIRFICFLSGPYWAAAFLTKSLASLRRLKKWRINPHFRSAPCSREPLVLAQ